jgi:hypothetical protein
MAHDPSITSIYNVSRGGADGENSAAAKKTAGHAKSGPAADPVGRGNDRMVAGSHYRLPERRDLGQLRLANFANARPGVPASELCSRSCGHYFW